MELTKDQQAMLDGDYDAGTQLAMKIQVAIGESFGAERMVPITRAHVALSNQEADLWFAEKLLGLGAKCRVAPTVNPGFNHSYFTERDMVDPEFADLMARTHAAYKALGAVLTYNCTPYIDTNVPNFGEVTAYSESSATPYVNGVWGARSNREGANSALCAAITGYVPEYGLLLDENRYANILVEVQADMKTAYDYHILGMCGKKIGSGIPAFTGLPKHVSKEAYRNLCAQLNTSGAYGMFHIIGTTPEAPDLETAFGGKEPARRVVITNEDFEKVLSEISLPGDREIDFVMFGCPHFTLEEVKHIADKVKGQKMKKEMWILTSSHVKQISERMGLDEIITEAGGQIVADTCPDQPCWRHLNGKIGITESPKCAYYPQRRGMHFVIRDLDTCIDAALTGEVK